METHSLLSFSSASGDAGRPGRRRAGRVSWFKITMRSSAQHGRQLDGGPIPVNQYWAAYIYVEDADALCAEVREQGVEIVRELEDSFYGLRDFDIRDPDGHLLAFGHDLEPAAGEAGLNQGESPRRDP